MGALPYPIPLGYVPAALFASPGTAVRAAVLWLTLGQLEALTLMELGYRLGRLDRARFVMDEADVEVADLYAYVSRPGALCLDGEPVALAAVPARGRRSRALTQEELLEAFAALAFGPGTTAADVARTAMEGMGRIMARLAPLTVPAARHLPSDAWTPFPGG